MSALRSNRVMTGLLAVAAVIAIGASFVGCGDDSSDSGSSSTAETMTSGSSAAQGGMGKTVKIDIVDFEFGPKAVAVAAGSKVEWTNEDSAPHTATDSVGAAFDTGSLQQGDSASATLSKPGKYAYICSIHPFMKGTLTVK